MTEFDRFRQDAGLSFGELWLRYFALGGMSTPLQVEAILYGALEADGHDRNVLAQAINERFLELGEDHPVPYVELSPPPRWPGGPPGPAER